MTLANDPAGRSERGKLDPATAESESPLPKGFLGILTIVFMVCGPSMVGMMLTICLPILPNMVAAGHGDKAALISMPTAGIVVGGILAGFLLSRMSARALMLTMIALFGVIGAAGMVLEGNALLISRFLTGVVATCVSAASTTQIGEHIPLKIRPRVLGMQMAGSSLVGIVAMNISGARTQNFGWHTSFTLFPIIAIILLVPGVLLLPASRVRAAGEKTSRDGWRLIFEMWPVYLFLLVVNGTVYLS